MIKIQKYMSEDEILEQYPKMRVRLIIDDNVEYLQDGGYKNVWAEDAFSDDKEFASILGDERDSMIEFNKVSGKHYSIYNSFTDSTPYLD